jgi:CBS domain-containing protein/gamma-glutamylcysteine synthetase
MGEQDVTTTPEGEQLRAFTKHLLNDLRALERMIADGLIESGVRRIGAEQEMVLVDRNYQPAPISLEVLDTLGDDHFTTELARFNIECNLDPLIFGGDCLRRMERQLCDRVTRARRAAQKHEADVLLTGIAPTLGQTHISMDYITPKPRYYALNDALSRMRGGEYEFRLSGTDELVIKHDSVMLEACNTSFQVHFQVSPEEFARRYNIAQAVLAPVLAVAANSPLLFGKRLWHETRIELFQQAVDTRSSTHQADERMGRVSFGQRWVEESVMEIFREDVSRFRVLLSSELGEDPFDVLDAGGVPELRALRLHNSTVYRWNRPCYGIHLNKPHLRIENRVLPAGPTVVDSIANAALWFGLMGAISEVYGDVTRVIDFDDVKGNFLSAARLGMRAQFTWLDAEKPVPAQTLIRDELLPLARKGLLDAGIDAEDVSRYLGIIEQRLDTGRNGANWLLASLAGMKGQGAAGEKLTSVTATALDLQWRGDPVHTWPLAKLDRADTVRRSYRRVEQYMTTDLFTVNADDSVELVANMMVWEGIRHVPVEDSQHRLVGLVAARQLLRVMGESPLKGREEPIAVSEIMQVDPLTAAPDMSTIDAIRLMRDKRVSCLPVVKNGTLVGIITDYDFLEIAADMIERELAE